MPFRSPHRLLLTPLLFAILFAGLFSACGPKNLPGKIPEISLLTYESKPYTFGPEDNQVTLVVFWATWCQPCLEEIPDLVQLQTKYGKQGFRVVGINIDDPEGSQAIPIAQQLGVNYPMLIGDQETEAAFGGLRALPTSFLIGRDGRVKRKLEGLHSAEKVERMVQEQL
jgi:thiol-disulfide isomerase/thioredoxin